MGIETKIQWAHHTFNPWWGCAKVSPGCAHCYAETFAKRTGHGVWGKDAPRRFFGPKHWDEPRRWNDAALKAGERRRVFCASMADVFEDRRDLDVERARLWNLIAATPGLDWLLLTKRPDVMRCLWPWKEPPANVWAGTTVEDQERAQERIPELLHVPAVVHFLSCEPLLGPVDLYDVWMHDGDGLGRKHMSWHGADYGMSFVDWVIAGGESGPGARMCGGEWIRSLVQQCRGAEVPVFVKQLGANYQDPVHGLAGKFTDRDVGASSGVSVHFMADQKGCDMAEWPDELRVRELPTVGAWEE